MYMPDVEENRNREDFVCLIFWELSKCIKKKNSYEPLLLTGQKSSKHRDSDGEPAPSPRKSPKRTGMKSLHEETPQAASPRRSESASFMEQRSSSADSADIPKSKSLTLSSPSTKPAVDKEQKENVPQVEEEQLIPSSPVKMNGNGVSMEPLTPKRINGEMMPRAASTPNGVLCSELSE